MTYGIKLIKTPSAFQEGVIVPVLKKSHLNQNDASRFRPITISSVLSKLLELLLLPKDSAYKTQFGFRQGRNTWYAYTLLNDNKAYFEYK